MNNDIQTNETNVERTNGGVAVQGSAPGAPEAPATSPRYRTESTDHELRLHVELPGVAPEGVQLTVKDDVLELQAARALEPAEGPALQRHLEFRLTDFAARWRLPETVDPDGIASRLRHGVLELTLPLREPERRTIPVHGA